jgi:hypothetical protein
VNVEIDVRSKYAPFSAISGETILCSKESKPTP